jgi:hypothetical protein
MPSMAELRKRSDGIFVELLQAQTRARRPRRATRGAAPQEPRTFSWFDPEDAVAAATLSFQLAAEAASHEDVGDGLSSALDRVEDEISRSHPEQVRQGFALFVTHNQDGRRLAKPRTVVASPELFSPPRAHGQQAPSVSVGGLSPGLDYWREDVLANEHHQHWHEVYPYTGLPPRSFRDWLKQLSKGDLVEILNALQPDPQWADFVENATPAELAGIFAQVLNPQLASRLPARLYRELFRLNDRQGELFLYMHQQMLARYDAELLSNGLDRVKPFGPDAWPEPLAAGHDPLEVTGFGRREENKTLPDNEVRELQGLRDEIANAISAKELAAANGATVDIDRTNIGEAIEATVAQLSALDATKYQGMHNTGHVFISQLSANAPGVMISTVTAIRDQAFWQWHKFIDDLGAAWQEDLDPYDFEDAPAVVIRNGLEDGSTAAWQSPDIILCRSVDLPADADPEQLGELLFGGDRWDQDFSAAEASANAKTLQTVQELTTVMAPVGFGGVPTLHLTHEPFSYFFRLENKGASPLKLTVRVFLAPADQSADRRVWMEMDKFLLELPAHTKGVAYRPDTESSIIKRPSETSPAAVGAGDGDPGDNGYCDCGWPYTLLLPRGTEAGMAYRLAVVCTDASIDQVSAPEHCGSMSYCGAVDRYPDTRDMGYPFCRPFAGPAATAIEDTIVRLPQAAGRTITIRHAS